MSCVAPRFDIVIEHVKLIYELWGSWRAYKVLTG